MSNNNNFHEIMCSYELKILNNWFKQQFLIYLTYVL
jgi:hypothetical protein